MRNIVFIAHNLRSTHNVGSLLRTADGLGVSEVFLTGYTPYPVKADDPRLPHLAQKIDHQIAKTALGAEKSQAWQYQADITHLLQDLKSKGFSVVALEQAPGAIRLPEFEPPDKVAIILGREVEGIEPEVLTVADQVIEIPMLGHKESFNVVQAAAMALYHCRFFS